MANKGAALLENARRIQADKVEGGGKRAQGPPRPPLTPAALGAHLWQRAAVAVVCSAHGCLPVFRLPKTEPEPCLCPVLPCSRPTVCAAQNRRGTASQPTSGHGTPTGGAGTSDDQAHVLKAAAGASGEEGEEASSSRALAPDRAVADLKGCACWCHTLLVAGWQRSAPAAVNALQSSTDPPNSHTPMNIALALLLPGWSTPHSPAQQHVCGGASLQAPGRARRERRSCRGGAGTVGAAGSDPPLGRPVLLCHAGLQHPPQQAAACGRHPRSRRGRGGHQRACRCRRGRRRRQAAAAAAAGPADPGLHEVAAAAAGARRCGGPAAPSMWRRRSRSSGASWHAACCWSCTCASASVPMVRSQYRAA